MKWLLGAAAVSVDVVTRVRKRDIAHPERVIQAENASAVGYLVESLGAHQARDDGRTGMVELMPDVAGGESRGEI